MEPSDSQKLMWMEEARKSLLVVEAGVVVKAVIAGYDDLPCVHFFAEPLPGGKDTPYREWSKRIGFTYTGRFGRHIDLYQAVRERWPDAQVYDCMCTCCCSELLTVANVA